MTLYCPIQDVVMQNDTIIFIERFFSTEGNINTTDSYGNTSLHCAIETGQIDMIDFLIPLGADPTVQVTEEETLLECIGEDWSQLGFTFPVVLPAWPTDKDAEILQALQAYVPSP